MQPEHLPWNRLLQVLSRIENAILVILLGLMILLAGAQIIFRNLLDLSFLAVDPLLRMLVLWVALLGATAASRDNRHISIDLFSRWLPPRAVATARVLTDAFTVTVCVLMAWHAVRFVESERSAGGMLAAMLPMWIAQLILPVAFGLIALRYALHFGLHAQQALSGSPRDP